MEIGATNTSPSHLDRATCFAIFAGFLGWLLDAFDFFILVFLLKNIGESFGTDIKSVSEALFLTLAARPAGALVFGWMAERYGRRPVLMLVVLLYSVLSGASGLAQNLGQLLLIRTLFGFAMGGEWGVGASLVMESIPPHWRGRISGLLQAGYPAGYLLASLAYFLLFDRLGWRGMFFLGMVPALLSAMIFLTVKESPSFENRRLSREPQPGVLASVRDHWKLGLYLVVLMTAFNFFSHGTQDLYPTFLQKQHHMDTHMTGVITAIMNVGAIIGALVVAPLSERIGRRRAMTIASLLALPLIPLWAWSSGPVALAAGAFCIQVAVQGAWAVVPAHLNELSPPQVRAIFPGFVYQLGNLIASRNAPWQASIAESHGNNYGLALTIVAGTTAVVLAIWCSIGPERRDVAM